MSSVWHSHIKYFHIQFSTLVLHVCCIIFIESYNFVKNNLKLSCFISQKNIHNLANIIYRKPCSHNRHREREWEGASKQHPLFIWQVLILMQLVLRHRQAGNNQHMNVHIINVLCFVVYIFLYVLCTDFFCCCCWLLPYVILKVCTFYTLHNLLGLFDCSCGWMDGCCWCRHICFFICLFWCLFSPLTLALSLPLSIFRLFVCVVVCPFAAVKLIEMLLLHILLLLQLCCCWCCYCCNNN